MDPSNVNGTNQDKNKNSECELNYCSGHDASIDSEDLGIYLSIPPNKGKSNFECNLVGANYDACDENKCVISDNEQCVELGSLVSNNSFHDSYSLRTFSSSNNPGTSGQINAPSDKLKKKRRDSITPIDFKQNLKKNKPFFINVWNSLDPILESSTEEQNVNNCGDENAVEHPCMSNIITKASKKYSDSDLSVIVNIQKQIKCHCQSGQESGEENFKKNDYNSCSVSSGIGGFRNSTPDYEIVNHSNIFHEPISQIIEEVPSAESSVIVSREGLSENNVIKDYDDGPRGFAECFEETLPISEKVEEDLNNPTPGPSSQKPQVKKNKSARTSVKAKAKKNTTGKKETTKNNKEEKAVASKKGETKREQNKAAVSQKNNLAETNKNKVAAKRNKDAKVVQEKASVNANKNAKTGQNKVTGSKNIDAKTRKNKDPANKNAKAGQDKDSVSKSTHGKTRISKCNLEKIAKDQIKNAKRVKDKEKKIKANIKRIEKINQERCRCAQIKSKSRRYPEVHKKSHKVKRVACRRQCHYSDSDSDSSDYFCSVCDSSSSTESSSTESSSTESSSTETCSCCDSTLSSCSCSCCEHSTDYDSST